MKPYFADDTVTLYHGNCLEILPALEGQSVDLLLTDPPYGIGYVSGRSSHGRIAGDDGTLDVVDALKQALRCLRINHHFYVFGPADMASLTNGATADLVWDEGKHGAGNLDVPWGASWEPITFGIWSPYASHKGTGRHLARRRRGTVLRHQTPNNGLGALDHPTRKPVALLRELIEASSLIGEIVLDPFAGSGATLEAARLEGRRAVGIEIEERYCDAMALKFSQGMLDVA